MKKITTIILILMASFVFAEIDNETAELIDLVEQIKEVKEQKEVFDTVNQFISQRLFQLELQPKFMASRLAYRNTFMWYIWNDFDEANGVKKLEIAEQIFNLTK